MRGMMIISMKCISGYGVHMSHWSGEPTHKGCVVGTNRASTRSRIHDIALELLKLDTDLITMTLDLCMSDICLLLSAKAEALKLKEKEQRELERKYGKKKAKEVAEQNFQERIEDFERQEYEEERRKEQKARLNQEKLKEAEMKKDQPIDDSAVVDDMFGFLEEQRDSVNESQAPSAFRDLPAPKNGYGTLSNGDIIMGVPTTPEDYEDLSDFKFQKFATTYFQGNVTHQYSRRPLKYSLLPLQTQGDQLVSSSSPSAKMANWRPSWGPKSLDN